MLLIVKWVQSRKDHQYRETIAKLAEKFEFRIEKIDDASGGYGGDVFKMRLP